MARASKLKAAPGSSYRANKKVVEITTKKSEALKISSRQEQSILTKPPNFDYKNSDAYQLFDSSVYPDCTYTTPNGWIDVADACIFVAGMETAIEGGTVGGTLDVYLKTQAVCRHCTDDFWDNSSDCEAYGGIWLGDLEHTEASCTGEGYTWHSGELDFVYFEIHRGNTDGPYGDRYIENVEVTLDVNSDIYPGGFNISVLNVEGTYEVAWMGGGNTIPVGEGIFAKINFTVAMGGEYGWHGLCIKSFYGFRGFDSISAQFNNPENPGICSGGCSCSSETSMFTCLKGDLNGDYAWNIFDIIKLAVCWWVGNCFNQEPENTVWCTCDINGGGYINIQDIIMLVNCIGSGNCGEVLNGSSALDQVSGVYDPPEGITEEEQRILLGQIKKIASKYTARPDAKAGAREIYEFINKDSLLSSSINGNTHNIQVTNQTKDSLEFSWNNSCTNCDGSIISLSPTPLASVFQTTAYGNNYFSQHLLTSDYNSKIAFTSLNADTTYYLKNTFFNAYGSSDTFEFQTSTLSEPPDAAPASLSFSGNSQTGINLGWVNNCSNEEEVRIFLDSDYGFKPFDVTATLQPGSTSYTFTGLTADTDYNVWVDFYNTGGNRGLTGDFTTLETGPDASPTNLSIVTLGATTLHLMWSNNATNEDGIHIYRNSIDVKPGTPYSTIYATTPNQCFDSNAGCTATGLGLTPATEYFYWVSFFNTGGESNTTSGSTFTLEAAPDAAPSNLSLVPGATSIALSFTNTATNDDGVKIYRSFSNTQPILPLFNLTGTNITSYTDDALGGGLDTATEYYYWVVNYNEIAESIATSGSTSTLEVAPDAAPSNLSLVPGATSIALSFTNAATNDDGVKIYRNTISMKPAIPRFNLLGTNITSYTDDASGLGLSEGTLYYYWVSNFNEIAESSTVSGATTTQTSGTTWYHAHGGAMEINANCTALATSIRLNNAISHHHDPPTIAVGDYVKLDNEEMLVTAIPFSTRPVVSRAQNGTSAAYHASGTDVYVDHI